MAVKCCAGTIVLASAAPCVLALPTDGEIIAGQAEITQSAGALTVDQTTSRLAIDWSSFDIRAGESVTFRQPTAQSIVLNRVLGQDPSVILGNLSSNGQVFLLNPNGILFGAEAQVNAGALLASTLRISLADFLAGRYTFSGDDRKASVVNQGTLRAHDGGYVALLAPEAINEGLISAHLGTALLGSADQVTLTLDGTRLVGFNVDRAASEALVANRQLIQVDGGTAILSAQARDALMATVINNEGIVEARSVSMQGGVIRLDGGTSGVVANSGTLDASGLQAAEHGGRIEITGDKVALLSGAALDVRGMSGGGTILVGGDAHGANSQIRNAQAVYVDAATTMKADALTTGDGGKVVVWSDEVTRYAGAISARGGLAGGNGGFVETSGKAHLEAAGTVDASATEGKAGEWLLDPYDVTLSTAATSNGGFGGGLFTPSGDSAVANVATIQASLNGGTSVTIETSGAGTQAGNITVANAIAKTSGANATLTLNAANQINFAAGANLTSSTNRLNVTLNAGAGGITNLRNVNTNGGVLTVNSNGASTQATGSVISGTGTLVKQGTGRLTLSGANTFTGATTISGGTLVAGSAAALGTTAGGVVVANGATLEIANVAVGAEAITLNGSGAGGVGALVGTGIASLSGGVTLASASNLGASVATDRLTLSGVISGANALNKVGEGTLVLSGNNTYTGATTVNAGTLRLGAANRIANTSAVTVDAGATFDLNNFAEAIGSLAGAGNVTLGTATLSTGSNNTSTTFSGALSGTGGLTKAGTGAMTLAGTNTYTGVTTISAGTLRLAGGSAIADIGAVSLANTAGVVLDLNNTDETLGSLAGGGTTGGNVTLGTGTLTTGTNNTSTTYSGIVSGTGGLVKAGTGTLTLSGNNTYTGATTVNAGTLQLGAANRIANTSALTVAAGATFNLANFAETVGSVAGAGNITLGAATLSAGSDNTSTTFAGSLSGTGGFTKAGTGTTTLAGANTFTGATTISAGTLRLVGGSAIADTAAITVANVSGATLDLDGANETVGSLAGGGTTGGNVTLGAGVLTSGGNNTSTTYSGIVSGTGGLIKAGTGTLTLAAANTYSGTTTINAGTLAVTNTAALGTVAGATTVNAGGSLSTSVNITGEALALNGGTLTKDNAATTRTWSGTVSLASGSSTLSTLNGTLVVSGAVDGTGNVAKSGTGTLQLTGNNTYTGATAINGGMVLVAGGNGVGDSSAVSLATGTTLNLNGTNETIGSLAGAGTVTTGNGTLTTGGNDTSTTYSGVISGTGGLTKTGSGTLTLAGASTYTGATNISAGTLQLAAASRIADASAMTIAGGATLNLNNFAETMGSIGGAGNIALGTATLTAGGNNLSTTFSGSLSGTGGFTKTGSGITTFSGINSYTGTTTINAGILRLVSGDAIADAGTVSLANAASAVLDLANTNETIGSLAGGGTTGGNVTLGTGTLTAGGNNTSFTYGGIVSGTGGLTKAGTGTLTLSGANSYTGTTNVNAGTLRLGAANRIANTSALTVDNGARFDLNNFAETIGSLAGAGNVVLGTAALSTGSNNASTTFSGVISGTGAVTKTGTGTLTLSGANTYTGLTTISTGRLRLAGGSAIADTGAVTLANTAGASLDLDGTNETIGSLAGGGTTGGGVTLGTGTLTAGGNNTSTTYSGVISGTGALTKAGTGTLTLAAANTYSGATTIDAGTLSVTNAAALGTSAGGTTVNSSGTLSTSVNVAAEALALNGGRLTKDNAATTRTWSGAVTLASGSSTLAPPTGTLVVSGAIDGTGDLVKTGNGTLLLSGNNTWSGATTLNSGAIQLAGGNGIGNNSAVTLGTGTTLNLNGTSETIGSIAGAGTVTMGVGTLTTGGNDTSTTYAGVISGSGGIIKTGSGTLTLSGSNTYSGTTNIAAGTIAAANIASLGSVASGTTVANGATLQIDNVALNAESITLNGRGIGDAGALTGSGSASAAGPVTLSTTSRVGTQPGDSLRLGGVVNGPGGLEVTGGGTVLLNNAVGGATSLGFLTSDAPTTLVISGGLVRTSGAQTYRGRTEIVGSATLRTAGGDIVSDGEVIASGGVLTFDSGAGDVTLAHSLNDFASVGITSANAVSLVDANSMTLGASSVGSLNARTLSGDLTLNGLIAATASGDSIVLEAAGNFINTGGSLSANAGRWLVYSTDPSLNAPGALSPDFKRYNCTMTSGCLTAGTSIPAAGNGFLYSLAPSLYINADPVTTSYGSPGPPLTWSGSGLIDGDTLSSALTGTAARSNGTTSGSGHEAVGTYAITSGTLGSSLGYQLVFTGADYVIQPRALTVSAAGVGKVYDGNAHATVALSDNRIVGDSLQAAYSTAQFLDTNAGAGKAISVDGIELIGDDAGNYLLSSTTALTTADISPRPITVSADNQTKVYGSADPQLTYAVNAGELVDGDTLSGALTRVAGETVAGGPYSIAQGTLANPNYTLTFHDGVLTIVPATLTYVADPISIFQGAALPPFSGTVNGFVSSDTQASATAGALTFSSTSTGSSVPGSFALTGSGLTANFGNYIFVQAPGNSTAFTVQDAGPFRGALTNALQADSECGPGTQGSSLRAKCGIPR